MAKLIVEIEMGETLIIGTNETSTSKEALKAYIDFYHDEWFPDKRRPNFISVDAHQTGN